MKPKKAPPDGGTCAIYARYSSRAQNDASIEQQIDECKEYAAAHGLTVCEIYADRAISGRSDRRPEFQKMIRHAEAGHFGVVLTYKSNRIARNMLDALRYEQRLDLAGVKVVYCKENFGDNAAGRMALRMMMSLNEFYSENMAEDIRRGMHDGAKQCRIMGTIPLGYKRGDDGRFVIDEPAAEVVREIYRRYAEGEAQASIADDLNRRGIRTAAGRPFVKNSFQSILDNERYAGVYTFDGVRVEGGIPAIIDKDLFARVHDKVGRRKAVAGRRRDNNEYLLTGKLYCARCGAPMVGISGTSKTGALHCYYVCKSRRDDHTCDKVNVRKDIVEHEIAAHLVSTVLQPNVIDWMVENVLRYQEEAAAQSDLAAYEERLNDVQRALSNILKAIEAGLYSEATKTRLDELEAEKRELRALIASERAKAVTLTRDQVRFYLESFRDGDISSPAFVRRLFRLFLIRAYLDDDKVHITFNYADSEDVPIPDIEFPLADIADAECSYTHHEGVPEQAETNTWVISMIGRVFVLTVYSRIR